MTLFVLFIVMDDVIPKYFNEGFPYLEIRAFNACS